jgi:hypothetical protein
MASFATGVVGGAISILGGLLGMAFRAKGINRPNVPCASPGIGTTFIIPDANNVCSNDAEAKYQLVYLSKLL